MFFHPELVCITETENGLTPLMKHTWNPGTALKSAKILRLIELALEFVLHHSPVVKLTATNRFLATRDYKNQDKTNAGTLSQPKNSNRKYFNRPTVQDYLKRHVLTGQIGRGLWPPAEIEPKYPVNEMSAPPTSKEIGEEDPKSKHPPPQGSQTVDINT